MALRKTKPLPYNPNLKERARRLRKEGTLGEVLLWEQIRKKALGAEFHRQVPIDDYIVDFYCHEHKLAVEVDGSGHDNAGAGIKDLHRQTRLETLGVRVLRFREEEVRQNAVAVAEMILGWLEDNAGLEAKIQRRGDLGSSGATSP